MVALRCLLAVVGVYGVKAYAVACRTREIGIRMALGAHRKDVFALIMRQGALQTALAVTVGILLSLAAGRVLAQILYDVSPSDPFALFASSLMLAVAALLACFLARPPRHLRESNHRVADRIAVKRPRLISYRLSVIVSQSVVADTLTSDLALRTILIDQSLIARVLAQRVPGWIELQHRNG